MTRQGVGDFKYFVGIDSLARIATREDRVCVLNIMGGESSQVTPVSHAYSGGNVVFGTSPGRVGQKLATPIGDIPVFNAVREGLDAGLRFNTGVVYLPPSGVRDGVAELARVNADLEKIVIVTEKVSVHDAREIRAIGQSNGIDIFGANGLGVADAWNRVRIGGALGGDHPEESLIRGSVAIFSNSGNFTTTQHPIPRERRVEALDQLEEQRSGAAGARRLHHERGADVVVFAIREEQRPRPLVDLDLAQIEGLVARIEQAKGREQIDQRIGAGERALHPLRPDDAGGCRHHAVGGVAGVARGIGRDQHRVAHQIDLGGDRDVEQRPVILIRDLVDQGQGEVRLQRLHREVEHREPVHARDLRLGVHLGSAGAVLHGLAQQHGADQPIELGDLGVVGRNRLDHRQVELARQAQPLVVAEPRLEREIALRREIRLHPVQRHHPGQRLGDVGDVGDHRAPGRADRVVRREQLVHPEHLHEPALLGRGVVARAGHGARVADRAGELRLPAPDHAGDDRLGGPQAMLVVAARLDVHDRCLAALVVAQREHELGRGEVDVDVLAAGDGGGGAPAGGGEIVRDGAAISTTIAWGPLMRKRITRLTARTLPWYLRLYGVMIGASIPGEHHQRGSLYGIPRKERFEAWSMADLAFLAMTGKKPTEAEARPLQMLIGLLISNGPGSISAQGAKGAVSADGPQTPSRVQINKAMVGFLTHTGYSHGGNGFEGMAFLLDQFKATGLEDPTDPHHGLDLRAMASAFARSYREEKAAGRELGTGGPRALPGVHHPVFKGRPVNYDPRERFIAQVMEERGDYNIFHHFYRELVQALCDEGASPYVFCVNVDAVIAALLLALLWKDYQRGSLSERDLETAAFTVFLYGRMIGCAAEIDDHLNRGRNMDTRTPASACGFVT